MSVRDKKEYFRKHYQANKARYTAANLERHRKDPRIKMIVGARARASKAGVPFSINKDDIEIPEKCPALDIDLFISDGKVYDHSPTLDRLVPERGYVPGNVSVISHLANTIKNKGTSEQLRKIADWMDEKAKGD